MALSKENLYKQIVSKMTANGEKLSLSERSINENLDVLIPLLDNDSINMVTDAIGFLVNRVTDLVDGL